MIDLASLAAASSEFASSVGIPSDEAVRIFLDQFPLPVMISALQSASEVPGLESSLVLCLEKILKTQYGLSLLPQCLPYAQAGLNSTSPLSRRLACRAISQLLENDSSGDGAVRTISELDLWPSLLSCIADTDEGVATVASDAVKNLAKSSSGLELICPTELGNVTLLKRFADNSSSMVRIRILSLLSALFGISDEAASAIYRSGLLGLFEKELNRTDDILATLNALELLYEISLTANAGRSLVTKNLLKKLGSMISNSDTDPLLRSKAMSTTARLLSCDTVYSTVSKADINDAIQAIDMNLERLGMADNEKEVGIDALGLIGSVKEGAELLLTSSPPTARHVIAALFSYASRTLQLAAAHALANIAGQERTLSTLLLSDQAEALLRNLFYTATLSPPKKSPSGYLLSLLEQESDMRLAAYRLISALVVRPWCLLEVCRKKEIIDLVTDSHSETTKLGMELRHSCCASISRSLMASPHKSDVSFVEICEKLEEATKRGPYLSKDKVEPRPIVSVQERF